jgi:hypothetical protein
VTSSLPTRTRYRSVATSSRPVCETEPIARRSG